MCIRDSFTARAKKGDEVQVGDLLCEFDIDAIKAAGYEVTTPVVVSNYKKLGDVIPLPEFVSGQQITAGTEVLAVEPKPVVAAE